MTYRNNLFNFVCVKNEKQAKLISSPFENAIFDILNYLAVKYTTFFGIIGQHWTRYATFGKKILKWPDFDLYSGQI